MHFLHKLNLYLIRHCIAFATGSFGVWEDEGGGLSALMCFSRNHLRLSYGGQEERKDRKVLLALGLLRPLRGSAFGLGQPDAFGAGEFWRRRLGATLARRCTVSVRHLRGDVIFCGTPGKGAAPLPHHPLFYMIYMFYTVIYT